MKRFLIPALAVLTLVSCRQDENKLAQKYLDAARASMECGNYADSKLQIDSIREVYPKAFEARRQGIRLLQQVEMAEAERTIAFQDSVLSVLSGKLETEKKAFVFEKDEKYQDIGIYTVSSQALEKNLGRNYLRAQVDENGRLTIVSNYSGSSYIHHRSVRLTQGDNFVEAPVSDDFYEFKDLGVCYEKCNFTDGNDGGMASFVTMNGDGKIEVQLNGERTLKYTMTDADKKAVRQVYSFSLLLSSISEAAALRDEAVRKLQFVKANAAKAELAEEGADAESEEK